MEAGGDRSQLTRSRGVLAEGDLRPVKQLLALATVSLLFAALAVIAQAIEPFAHGVWLVAYLLLVGSLAPMLLGIGQVAVLEHPPPARQVSFQTALWSLGTVAVPLGVLGGTRLAVAVGSVALMLSLGSMVLLAHKDADSRGSNTQTLVAYGGLLLFMAGSVCIGLALAWDLPWL